MHQRAPQRWSDRRAGGHPGRPARHQLVDLTDRTPRHGRHGRHGLRGSHRVPDGRLRHHDPGAN